MKALGFTEHGGLDRLGLVDLPEPVPGPGQVRVRMAYAGLNRLDRFTLTGIPGVDIERPHALGSDGAGTVDAVGEGVRDLKEGIGVVLNPGLWDGRCEYCRAGLECMCREYRILGEHTQGTAAPYVVVPRRNVHPMPSGLSFAQAAAFPLVFQTAWRALRSVAALRAGETVAVIGAGGGVATAAVQVARLTGGRVVVASRSARKAERALALGAEAALEFTEARGLERVLWEWSGKRGIDVIFDSVGSPTLSRSVRALARGGRVIVVGATAGADVALDLRPLFWRQASIRGSTMGTRRDFDEVLAQIGRGTLVPVVDSEFALSDGRAAFERMDSPELFGKVVVRVAAA